MGAVKSVKGGPVEWRISRDLIDVAVAAKDEPEYQVMIEEILKSPKQQQITSGHPLLMYKRYVDQLKIVECGGEKLIYKDNKLIPPKIAREGIIDTSHQGHFGGTTIYNNLAQVIFWPEMHTKVMQKSETCRQCVINAKTKRRREPIIPLEVQVFQIGEMWSLDVFSKWGKQYLAETDKVSGLILCQEL